MMSNTPPTTEAAQSIDINANNSPLENNAAQVEVIVFDFATKQTKSCVIFLSSSPLKCFDALFC